MLHLDCCMTPNSDVRGMHAGLESFWIALQQQHTLQAQVPVERWDLDRLYDPEGPPGCAYVRFAALVPVGTATRSVCSSLTSISECNEGLPT